MLLVADPDFSPSPAQTACFVILQSPTCQPISFSGFPAERKDLGGGGQGLGP